MAQVINLNDAVYRIINRPINYAVGLDITCFNKTNCPLLHEQKLNSVVSWGDWVKILGGDPTAKYGRCLRVDQWEQNQQGVWGKSYGKPAGSKGRYLAEYRPLDETFFYYENLEAQFRVGRIPATATSPQSDNTILPSYPSTLDDRTLVSWYYYQDSSGWRWNLANTNAGDDVTPSTVNNWFVLPAGVYMAVGVNYALNDYTSSLFSLRNIGESGDGFLINRSYCNSYAVWYGANNLFFLDSPMEFRTHYYAPLDNGGMQGTLHRITPPGYWVQ
jgi:hypothetical protein